MSPNSAEALRRLGERIKLARVRRKLRQEDLAQRIGRSRPTVVAIEHGAPGTEIAAYVETLEALGLLEQLDLIADPSLDRDAQALVFSLKDRRVRVRKNLDNDF